MTTTITDSYGGEMHLKTNRHTRPLVSFEDLPESERSDFDYVQGEDRWSARFFEYRGSWYDLHEFQVAGPDVRSLGFESVQAESYFSAVVVSYFDRDGHILDYEIIVGYIHW